MSGKFKTKIDKQAKKVSRAIIDSIKESEPIISALVMTRTKEFLLVFDHEAMSEKMGTSNIENPNSINCS